MRYVFLLFTLLSLSLSAQTKFTERVQANRQGGGSLSLHQSQTITNLVNGPEPVASPVATPTVGGKPTTPGASSSETSLATGGQRAQTTGYRIQVYSGNNSRQGKNEATAMGRRVKGHFSELAVYTDFASPHWRCRVGDFRTYEEASDYLKRMHETGRFEEAVIVRSKIYVYY